MAQEQKPLWNKIEACSCYPVIVSYILIYLLQTYHKNKLLKNVFRIVSTSKDRKGIEFISTMEGT